MLTACANTGMPSERFDDAAVDGASHIDAGLGHDASQTDANIPAGEDVLVPTAITWRNQVRRLVDEQALTQYFENAGGVPRYAVDIYAVAVKQRPGGLAYRYFDVNKGAFSQAFWPASTIKLIAALAALTQVQGWGFTGEAIAKWSGFSDAVNDIAERAVRVSSNEDYDRTLQIAGNDYVNGEWLTEERGFPTTVLKASYARLGVINVPAFTLSEGDKVKNVPARAGTGNHTCESGKNNCTTLYELIEATRRLLLHDEVPADERFAINDGDRAQLVQASCRAVPSHFVGPSTQVFGEGTSACGKSGWVPDLDRLDQRMITAPSGLRYFLASAVPDSAASADELEQIAETTANFFASGAHEGDFWLQRAFGVQGQVLDDGSRWLAVGGAEVRLYADGKLHAQGRSPLAIDDRDLRDRWLTLEVYDHAGELVGIRHAMLSESQP